MILEANCLAFAKIILANFCGFIYHLGNQQSVIKAAGETYNPLLGTMGQCGNFFYSTQYIISSIFKNSR
jgi:hypothetical protein